jgi:hypothetical protein
MHAPECLHGHLLGCVGVADDAEDPAVNGSLVEAKERLEGVDTTFLELIKDAACAVLHLRSPF